MVVYGAVLLREIGGGLMDGPEGAEVGTEVGGQVVDVTIVQGHSVMVKVVACQCLSAEYSLKGCSPLMGATYFRHSVSDGVLDDRGGTWAVSGVVIRRDCGRSPNLGHRSGGDWWRNNGGRRGRASAGYPWQACGVGTRAVSDCNGLTLSSGIRLPHFSQ